MKKILTGAVLTFALIIPTFSFAETVSLTDQFETDISESGCVELKFNLGYRSRDALTNGEVSVLQNFLIDEGYLSGETTGYFGLVTRDAVQKFQIEAGIGSLGTPGYGNVGPKSRVEIKEMTCGDAATTDTVSAGDTTPILIVHPCTGSAVYSSITGQACVTPPSPFECAHGAVYSSVTGQECVATTATLLHKF